MLKYKFIYVVFILFFSITNIYANQNKIFNHNISKILNYKNLILLYFADIKEIKILNPNTLKVIDTFTIHHDIKNIKNIYCFDDNIILITDKKIIQTSINNLSKYVVLSNIDIQNKFTKTILSDKYFILRVTLNNTNQDDHTYQKKLFVFNRSDLTLLKNISFTNTYISIQDFVIDGNRLFYLDFAKLARLDLNTLKYKYKKNFSGSNLLSVDNNIAVTYGNKLNILDAKTLKYDIFNLYIHKNSYISDIAIYGDFVVTAGGHTLRLWDKQTFKLIKTLYFQYDIYKLDIKNNFLIVRDKNNMIFFKSKSQDIEYIDSFDKHSIYVIINDNIYIAKNKKLNLINNPKQEKYFYESKMNKLNKFIINIFNGKGN